MGDESEHRLERDEDIVKYLSPDRPSLPGQTEGHGSAEATTVYYADIEFACMLGEDGDEGQQATDSVGDLAPRPSRARPAEHRGPCRSRWQLGGVYRRWSRPHRSGRAHPLSLQTLQVAHAAFGHFGLRHSLHNLVLSLSDA